VKILITGCAGFIGFHLVNNLIKSKSVNIYGIDNLDKHTGYKIKKDRLDILKKNKNFIFKKLDISHYSSLKKIFDENKFEIVINLAALAGIRNSLENPKKYFLSNIIGFYNILDICIKSNVKKLLFASSSSVYGEARKYPTKESDITDLQSSFYASTKKINELIAKSLSQDKNLIIIGLRFFTVYGPFGRPDMFLFKLVSSILNQKKFNVFNYGNHYRDFTYVDDIIKILKKIIFSSKKINKNFEIFNLGSGKTHKIIDVVKHVQKQLNTKGLVNLVEAQAGDVFKTQSDSDLIQKKFGRINFTTIDKGIKKYIKWHKLYDK